MKTYLVVLTLLLSLLCTSCTQMSELEGIYLIEPETTVSITETKTQSFALPYTQDAIHPILSSSSINLALSGLIWESLFVLDQNFEATPLLCQSYTISENGLVWTIQLRSDVTFSDGTPLTAEEVVFSLRLAMTDSPTYAQRLTNLANVTEVEGDVVITLYQPNGSLDTLLDIPIVKGESEEPLGTGPYVLTGWGTNRSLVVRRDWWQDQDLPLDEIPLNSLPELDDLISAFHTGEISMVSTNLTSSQAISIDGTYETRDYPSSTLLFVGYRCDKGVCSDATVRQALGYAMDRTTLTMTHYAQHSVAATLPVHPNSSLYDQTLASTLTYQTSTTTALLEEAGWTQQEDGTWTRWGSTLSLTFIVNTDNPFRLSAANYIAGELERLGILVDLQELTWTDFQTALTKGNFDLYLGEVPMSADFDPSIFVEGGTVGYGGYSSYEMNQLLWSYQAATGTARTTAASALYQLWATESPITPLSFQNYSLLTQWGVVSNANPTQQNLFYQFWNWSLN